MYEVAVILFLCSEQEIGDVENWARSIEMDMRTIATALEYVHKGQLQSASSWNEWRERCLQLKQKSGRGLSSAQIEAVVTPLRGLMLSITLSRETLKLHFTANCTRASLLKCLCEEQY